MASMRAAKITGTLELFLLLANEIVSSTLMISIVRSGSSSVVPWDTGRKKIIERIRDLQHRGGHLPLPGRC